MRILIAEDDFVSRRVLEAALVKQGYEVVITEDGEHALEELQKKNGPSLAILDWMMPGTSGIDVCRKIRASRIENPVYIIILTSKSAKTDMVAGLEAGADDYLTKPFDHTELRARLEVGKRVLRLQQNLANKVNELNLALAELKTAEAEVRKLSVTDELTGIYNRRGFIILSEQQQKLARRNRCNYSVIYADMDGLKSINDTFGHHEGSKALCSLSDIIKNNFRASDIVARIGGDEFAIFINDITAHGLEIIETRLREKLAVYNSTADNPYQLSVSYGTVFVTPDDDSSLEDLMCQADGKMYEIKKKKKETANHNTDRASADKTGQ